MRFELVEVGRRDSDDLLPPAVDLTRDGSPKDLIELREEERSRKMISEREIGDETERGRELTIVYVCSKEGTAKSQSD